LMLTSSCALVAIWVNAPPVVLNTSVHTFEEKQ